VRRKRMFEQLSRLYFNTGLDLLHSGKINDALIVLKNAVSLDDTNVSAWNLLGLCYYNFADLTWLNTGWMERLKVNTHGNKAMSILKCSIPLIRGRKRHSDG
jgi:Flp pilus assembly protein TadD